MTEKTEALRLADALKAATEQTDAEDDVIHVARWFVEDADAELRRLHQHEFVNEVWQVKTQWVQDTAKPEELGMHRADVMRQRLEQAKAQRDALLEALKEITPSMPPVDAPCHYGIVPQEKCGHCGRIAKARAAIKAVEEEA